MASPPPPASTNTGDFGETVAWGATTEVNASEIVEKGNLVRDITSMQSSLKALMARVAAVRADCTKAEADNEMLQTYIDSVTKSLAAKS